MSSHTVTRAAPARQEPTRPGLMRKVDAASYLGISTRTLDRMVVRGEGPALVTFGRQRLYRVEDLETFLSAHLHGGGGNDHR